MTIIVVTGMPGAGKTAHVVDMLAHGDQFQGRPLFVMGIPDLQIDHFPVPPVDEWTELRADKDDPSLLLPYFTFPPNAVIVLDEAQRVYRPRPVGSKVPPYVAAFETHRHTGVDFILMTQHPGLLDANVKKLVGVHKHVHVTALRRYLLEWRGCGEPDSRASRDLAARKPYKPPKRVFSLYKSAEVHTKIKVAIPWYYYVFALALLSAVAAGWYIYNTIQAKTAGKPPEGLDALKRGTPRPANGPPVLSPIEYARAYLPRLEGLAHTAPAYDEVTKPKQAPWPAGCMKSAKACRCYDQQGNTYKTTENVCKQIIADGMFKPWEDSKPAVVATVAAPHAPPALPPPSSPPAVVADAGNYLFPKK